MEASELENARVSVIFSLSILEGWGSIGIMIFWGFISALNLIHSGFSL